MASPRVVIVEDHAMVRQLLAALVKDTLQLSLVAECATMAEGIAACLREQPDLAIIDWALPDGQGFDIVYAVRAKLPHMRWLFLSSNEQESLVREAVEIGVQGFVLKRADLPTLQEAIARVLRGETYYCSRSSQLFVETMRSPEATVRADLTTREQQVLRAYARGESLKSLAEKLELSPKTINNLLAGIKMKLGLHEPGALVRYAIKNGFVDKP